MAEHAAGVRHDRTDGGEEGYPGGHCHLAHHDVPLSQLARFHERSDHLRGSLSNASGSGDTGNDARIGTWLHWQQPQHLVDYRDEEWIRVGGSWLAQMVWGDDSRRCAHRRAAFAHLLAIVSASRQGVADLVPVQTEHVIGRIASAFG